MKKEREDSEKKHIDHLEELVEIRTKELRESEEKYRELFEEAPYAYFSIGIDKSIKRCNKAAERLLNYSKEELLNMTVPDLYADTKNGLEKAIGVFQRFLSGKEIYDEELQMKTKDGNHIWISLSVKPVLDANGKIIESRSIVRDITERKQVEQELKIKEFAIRSSINAIAIANLKGILTYVNPSFLTLWGYSSDTEVLGNFNRDYWKAKEKANEIVEHIQKTGNWVGELSAKKKDGSYFYVQLSASMIYDITSKPISILASFIDITDRKKVEQKLKESEEKYRELANSLPQVIAETDERGNLTFVNKNAYSVFGYTPDDFNKGLNALQMLIPEDRKRAMENIKRVLRGKKVEKMEDNEYTALRKDGSTFPIIIYSSPIIYNDISVGTRSIIIDITDRKKAEKEITNALEEIKRSNAELEQFAYVASHDLQEPLRMVSGFANLLEKRYRESLDEDARDFIDFIIDGAKRMHNLINDLLTFSRIGTQGKVFKPTDMNVVLEASLNNVRISANETNTIITNDPLPVIIADESQMVQLLQNLISNAIKFHGSVTPKIHISGEVKKDEWIFTVRDNGIGIDSKNFERIFVIFQRLHKKGEYLGTGIGLAVCKKIVQRHGGKIWVESKLKKGTTFYFTISRNKNGVSASKK